MIFFILFELVASTFLRRDCGVVNDTYDYDFTQIDALLSPIEVPIPNRNATFLISLCTPITDFQFGSSVEYQVLGVRIGGGRFNRSDEIIYKTDFDYYPFTKDPKNGIIYKGTGTYIQIENTDNFQEHEVIFTLVCDDSATQPRKEVYYENESLVSTINIEIYSKDACPSTASATPTPTPNVSPDCHYRAYYPQSSTEGVELFLDRINNGPYGIRSLIVARGGQHFYAWFYTPCGIGECPIGANCGGENWSSSWLCSFGEDNESNVIKNCTSYGLQDNKSLINPSAKGGLYDGVVVTHKTDSRQTQVHYKCNLNVPDGYISPQMVSEYDITESLLPILVETSDVCPQDLIDPIPSNGSCSYTFSEGNYHFTANLTRNEKDGGFQQNVTLRSSRGGQADKVLFYQPCNPLNCPLHYNCEGDDNGNVWLCDVYDPHPGKSHFCVGYGLVKHGILAFVQDDYIYNGLEVGYYGDHQRATFAHWVCNRTLSAGEFHLGDSAYLFDDVLLFTGDARDVCPEGDGPTPSPKPSNGPPRPTPTATPFVHPSPYPVFWHHNDTHYVYANLAELDHGLTVQDGLLVSQAVPYAIVISFFSPWTAIDCPETDSCYGLDTANLYTCWNSPDGRVCHATGYKNWGVRMFPIISDNLDAGFMLDYGGAYDVDADIRVVCVYGENLHSISDFNEVVTYHIDVSQRDFEYTVESDVACPRPFHYPHFPPDPGPTPKPDAPTFNHQFRSYNEEGFQIIYNIDEINFSENPIAVFLDSEDRFSKDWIFFDPKRPIGCPSNYSCNGISWTANAWRCFEGNSSQRLCYPIGDEKYGLNISLFNQFEIEDGILVHYSGGYADHSFSFRLQCDYLGTKGFTLWRETGFILRHGSHSRILISGESLDVCLSPYINDVFVSSIILLILFFSFGLYFLVGSFYTYIRSGAVSIPNQEFWAGFFENVSVGFIFLITCGKKVSFNHHYEEI